MTGLTLCRTAPFAALDAAELSRTRAALTVPTRLLPRVAVCDAGLANRGI